MKVTVRQLAELVQGQVVGDSDVPITAARSLSEAQPGDITFVENDNHARELHACRASAVVAPPGVNVNGLPRIQAADARRTDARVHSS